MLVEALKRAEITHSDEGRSGFQLSFGVGREGPKDASDYLLVSGPWLKPFARVILTVQFGVRLRVLVDGIITNVQLDPGTGPGTGTLSVTGEDVSVMMDLNKVMREHPAQPEPVI